jgi:outer membrane protein insertion porin family
MGKGQELRAGINYSSFSKSVELGFTEPYLFDRNIAVGFDMFRRDFASFNFVNNDRNTTYEQVTTGGQLRAGVPLTEYTQLALRYGLSLDKIELDRDSFFSDPDGPGPAPEQCDPLLAGRFLCEQIGERTVSTIGYSLVYNTLNNGIRPSSGNRVIFSQDFAGLGGSVRYLRSRITGAKYWNLGAGFIGSVSLEGGYNHSFNDSPGPGIDPLRLTDRFFLGEPQIRGFDIRGVGPRVLRIPLDADGNPITERRRISDDAIGGRAYYLARAEVEIPLGSGAKDLGLRPSVFLDVGALFGVRRPLPTAVFPDANNDGKLEPLVRPILTAEGLRQCITPPPAGTPGNGTVAPIPNSAAGCPSGSNLIANSIDPFIERFVGNTPKPRVSVGFGVNWNSPFGPFRIDIAKALVKSEGDDTKLITFNVGTAF